MKSIQDKLLSRIYGNGRGWSFSKCDFADLGGDAAVRQSLSRLVKNGVIRRIGRGLYEYPRHSKLLGGLVVPDYHLVASAIARKHGWSVQPSGAVALNLVKLSTQVPAQFVYLSDGPTQVVRAEDIKISFKNAPLKEIKLKPKTSLLVQAIKSMGRDQFDDQTIEKFRKAFTETERNAALKDALGITAWVYEILRKIVLGGKDG